MKMCDVCFELYDEEFNLEHCPKKGCEGSVVDIDSDIAWPISMINIELTKQKMPARTNFCCSGHLPDSVHPYLGFDFDTYVFDNMKEVKVYMNAFNKEIVNIPLKALNKNLSECSLITVKKPYTSKIDIISTHEEVSDTDVGYYYARLFINDLDFRYGKELHTELERCYAVNYIQKYFKDFLLDCIASIKSTPKELKIM